MGRMKMSEPRAVATGIKKRRPRSHSPLRDPIWAVIADERTITGFTHRKAFQIAKELRGVVTTSAAANRQSTNGL